MTQPETGETKGAAHWRQIALPFTGPDNRRSTIQLSTTVILFLASWAGMYFSLKVSYFLTLALAIPTAGFVVRLFMIQHDCGHGSYFSSKKVRDAAGFVIGVITLTPYHYWRKTHALHHSHSGDLDFRGFGDILTYTVEEYHKATPAKRFSYRLYRNPLVLLLIGPAFHFLVKHRYPWDIPRDWKDAWKSIWGTNIVLALVTAAMALTIGIDKFLMIQIPVTLIACSTGVWLFYVQHQYEDSYWHRHDNWNYFDAALEGSSHLVLPKPLQWITASIGLHHVHHLNAFIPNYRLQACLDANKELQQAKKITITQTLNLFRLSLFDEAHERMISFRELRRYNAHA